jgi:DNA-binding MarR family transcriptional regulator
LSEQLLSAPAVRVWTRLLRGHATATRLLAGQLQSDHGLSINDYEALVLLAEADGGRLRRVDLARRLGLTPSGVTRLLEGLERAELVTRAECSEDLRVTYAELTEAGRARLEQAMCAHAGAIRELFEQHLTCDEIETLAALLAKLPGVGDDDRCPATAVP